MRLYIKSIIFAFAFCLTLLSALSLQADQKSIPPLQIMTEKWEPYQIEKGGNLSGISVDLMVTLLERTGSKQDRSSIRMLPWARAYNILKTRPNSVLFLTTQTPQRQNLFKWVGPIFKNSTYLIAKKSRKIEISNPRDISNFRIGTIIEDAGVSFLHNVGVNKNSMHLTTNSEFNLKLIEAGRIDMVVDNWQNFETVARSIEINPESYERVYLLDSTNVSIAFNKDTPSWIIERMQHTLESLRAEGYIDALFEKYNVQ